jgi:hypothetical protein
MRSLALVLLCAGCSDIFALPINGGSGRDFAGAPPGSDLSDVPPSDDMSGGGGGGGGGSAMLPASCARLSCSPTVNEGDVSLTDGTTISGCHAYDHLTISYTVKTTQFVACANVIDIGGLLDASGGGAGSGMGVGGGGGSVSCAGTSGGGHGGVGGDPGGCGGGAVYGDINHPRELGSGGGGPNGGKGGGSIELVAGSLNLLSFIRANGADGDNSPSAGGGSGGSLLIDVDNAFGAGRLEAHGGAAFGVRAGGGGGGRVALYIAQPAVRFAIDVSGGNGSGAPNGAVGTTK